jgi:hypothetical protein
VLAGSAFAFRIHDALSKRFRTIVDKVILLNEWLTHFTAYAGDIDISAISTSSEPEATEQLEGANNNTVLGYPKHNPHFQHKSSFRL